MTTDFTSFNINIIDIKLEPKMTKQEFKHVIGALNNRHSCFILCIFNITYGLNVEYDLGRLLCRFFAACVCFIYKRLQSLMAKLYKNK